MLRLIMRFESKLPRLWGLVPKMFLLTSYSKLLSDSCVKMMVKQSLVISTLMAIGFWILESITHRYIFQEDTFEFFPGDGNELWMRMIIVFLIYAAGIIIGIQNGWLVEKERGKLKVFRAAVRSSQHILNNHLNQMQYFMLKTEAAGLVDPELKRLFEESLAESCDLLDKLSQVDEPCELKIENAVQPWKEKFSA